MAMTSTSERPVPYVFYDGEETDDMTPARLISPSRAVAFVYYDGDSDSEKTPATPRQSPFGRKTALQKLACGLCFNPVKTASTDYHDLVHTPGDELEAAAEGENPYFLTTEDIQAAGIEAEQALVVPRGAPVFEVTVEETLHDDASVAFAAYAAALESEEDEDDVKVDAVVTAEATEESTALSAPSTPASVRISPSPSSSVALSTTVAAGAHVPVVTTSHSNTSVQTASSTSTTTGAATTATTSTPTSSATSSPKQTVASSAPSSPSPLIDRLNKFKKMLNTRSPSSSFKVDSLQVSEPVDIVAPALAPNTKETVSHRDVKVQIRPATTTTTRTEDLDATPAKTTTTTTTTTTTKIDGGETIVRIVKERHSVERLDTPLLLGSSVSSSEDMKPDEVSLLSSTAPSSLPVEWTRQSTPAPVMTTFAQVPPLPATEDMALAGTPPSQSSVHPLDAPAPKKEQWYRRPLEIRKGSKHKSSAVGSDNNSGGKQQQQQQQQQQQKSVPINKAKRTSSTMSSTTAEGASEPGSLTSIHEHMVQAAPPPEEKSTRRKSVMKKIGKILNHTTKRRQGSMVLEGTANFSEEPQSMDRRSSF
ncbi:hypothetical protein DFQ27_003962 [Actinomortierella ambigua]|uniref:Uncharacterized protein n=1 Tax=Actinomortierella ambigua TaxID=1343610 RepID=A0A9P6U4T7_9FUNG|nr:hypothetical protein DFQ27_003962 [Actinomortierella ambigua]